jgi:hypothetical protein
MKKAYEIWFAGDRAETGMLIPVSEIEQKVATFGDATVYRLDEPATDERIAELNRMIEDWAKVNDFHWSRWSDVEEFFGENGIGYKIHSDDYYAPSGNIVYCQGEFYGEDQLDTFAVYTWWDGSNWKDLPRPEPSEEGYFEEVEFNESNEKSLDEWDGNNYTNGSTGRHDYVVRLGDDRNLMIYRSQWQGEHTEAQIMTDVQYAEYCKGRGLDK